MKGKETVITCCMKYDVSLSGCRILVPIEVYVLSTMYHASEVFLEE